MQVDGGRADRTLIMSLVLSMRMRPSARWIIYHTIFCMCVCVLCIIQGELVEVPKVLGDLLESILGAVFLDSGHSLSTVWKVFRFCICKYYFDL